MSKFRSILASIQGMSQRRAKKTASRRREELFSQAMTEVLEARMMFTFSAVMSAPQSVHQGVDYKVTLNTTGGVATKWVINWGDGIINTYTNTSPGFAAGYQPPAHAYQLQQPYAISATAYTSANVSSLAAMTLSNSFGNGGGQNAPGSGKATAVPTNSTGDARGQAMAVDHSGLTFDGYIYVACNYTAFGGTMGQQFAITRFTPQGAVDQTWANVGTLAIPKFVSGTNTDTPADTPP